MEPTAVKTLTYTDTYDVVFVNDNGDVVYKERVEGAMRDVLGHCYADIGPEKPTYSWNDTPNPYFGSTVAIVYSTYGTALVTIGDPDVRFPSYADIMSNVSPTPAPEPTPAQAPDLPTFPCYKCGQPVTPFTGDFDAPNLGSFDGTHANPRHDNCPPPPPPLGFDNKPLSARLRRATDHIGRGTGAA